MKGAGEEFVYTALVREGGPRMGGDEQKERGEGEGAGRGRLSSICQERVGEAMDVV